MSKKSASPNGNGLLGKILAQQLTQQLPDDEEARSKWPHVWEMLITTHPDEDHVIEPATFSVRLGAGCWNWSLTSRDLKCGFSGYSASLAGCLDQAEAQLSSQTVQYRKVGRGDLHLRKRKV